MDAEFKTLLAELEEQDRAYAERARRNDELHIRWEAALARAFAAGGYLSRIVWRLSRTTEGRDDVWVLESLRDDPAAKELFAVVPDGRRFDVELAAHGLKFDRQTVTLKFLCPETLAKFCEEHRPVVRDKDDNELHREADRLRRRLAAVARTLAATGGAP